MQEIGTWLGLYGLRVAGALLILAAGLWGAKLLTRLARRIMAARGVEPTLISFAASLTHAAMVVFVVIAALAQLGVQTASLVAVVGAAGLAVGLALQGSLSNFAAGVLILVFRPFKVGDVIEAAGVVGTVEDLQMFTTQLKTGDNKAIFLPNAKLAGDKIINYSLKGTRRMDLVVGVGYRDDLRRVKEVLLEVLAGDGRVLREPAPLVAVTEFGESSVNFAVRPWVNAGDYWNVYFDFWERLKLRFDDEGISIPYPQRDVHLHSVGEGR